MIAEYWIVNKGKVENFRIKPGFAYQGILAWLAGSAIAIVVKSGIQPVNGIIVSMAVYLILNSFMNKK